MPEPDSYPAILSRPSALVLPDNPTTTDKIDAILKVMGMSKEDLRKLLNFILGIGSEVSEPEVLLAGADADHKENVLAYLDTMERRQVLAAQGYPLPPQELAAMFGSAAVTFDEQTLQLIEPSGLRRFLGQLEIKKLAVLLTQLELALKVKLQAGALPETNDARLRSLKESQQVALPTAALKNALDMDIARMFRSSQLTLKSLFEGAANFMETLLRP